MVTSNLIPMLLHFCSYFIKQVGSEDAGGASCLSISGLEGWVMLDADINFRSLALLSPHPFSHPWPPLYTLILLSFPCWRAGK